MRAIVRILKTLASKEVVVDIVVDVVVVGVVAVYTVYVVSAHGLYARCTCLCADFCDHSARASGSDPDLLLEDPPMVSPPSLRLEGPKIKRRPIILRHFQVAPPYIFPYKPHFLVSLFNIIDP